MCSKDPPSATMQRSRRSFNQTASVPGNCTARTSPQIASSQSDATTDDDSAFNVASTTSARAQPKSKSSFLWKKNKSSSRDLSQLPWWVAHKKRVALPVPQSLTQGDSQRRLLDLCVARNTVPCPQRHGHDFSFLHLCTEPCWSSPWRRRLTQHERV